MERVSDRADISLVHSSSHRLLETSLGVAFLAFVTVVSLIPRVAHAQHRISEDCPDTFSIVDTGVWATDDDGNFIRALGGNLVDIGRQDKAQPDTENAWVTCYPPSNASKPTLDRDGNSIPLVSHVVFPTGLGFTQNENTERTIKIIGSLFRSHFPEVPVSEVNFGNGLGTGLCKLGRENERGAVFQNYACLTSMDRDGEATLFFYCQAHPQFCAYYVSLGKGVMAYQQPSDYPFTRTANSLDDAVQSWFNFALAGQAYIEERRVAHD